MRPLSFVPAMMSTGSRVADRPIRREKNASPFVPDTTPVGAALNPVPAGTPPNWKMSKSVRKKLRFSGKKRLNRSSPS